MHGYIYKITAQRIQVWSDTRSAKRQRTLRKRANITNRRWARDIARRDMISFDRTHAFATKKAARRYR